VEEEVDGKGLSVELFDDEEVIGDSCWNAIG
jgi:hypothetical protein